MNSTNLKSVLWETLLDVKDEKLRPQNANAITGAASGITSIIKLEVYVQKMLGKKPTENTMMFLT